MTFDEWLENVQVPSDMLSYQQRQEIFVNPETADYKIADDYSRKGMIYADPKMNIEREQQINEYKVNENGETYGIIGDACDFYEMPDLIAVVGNSGIEGYVRKTDFELKPPASPEDAVKYMEIKRKLEEQGFKGTLLPIYDVDGIMVVDTFTVKF